MCACQLVAGSGLPAIRGRRTGVTTAAPTIAAAAFLFRLTALCSFSRLACGLQGRRGGLSVSHFSLLCNELHEAGEDVEVVVLAHEDILVPIARENVKLMPARHHLFQPV